MVSARRRISALGGILYARRISAIDNIGNPSYYPTPRTPPNPRLSSNPDGIRSLAKYSKLPVERIRYVPEADEATVRSIGRGVLFLMAFRSGSAVQAFARLTE